VTLACTHRNFHYCAPPSRRTWRDGRGIRRILACPVLQTVVGKVGEECVVQILLRLLLTHDAALLYANLESCDEPLRQRTFLKLASLYRWRWLALLIPPADSTCDMTNEPSTSGNPGAYDLPARLRSSIQEVRSCDDQSTDWRLLDCSTARLLDCSTARLLDCHTLTGAVARSSVRIGSTRCRVGFVPSTQGTLA